MNEDIIVITNPELVVRIQEGVEKVLLPKIPWKYIALGNPDSRWSRILYIFEQKWKDIYNNTSTWKNRWKSRCKRSILDIKTYEDYYEFFMVDDHYKKCEDMCENEVKELEIYLNLLPLQPLRIKKQYLLELGYDNLC